MSYIPDRTQPREDSDRVAETKNRIKKAFFQLYKEKRIEKISIKELTDLAGINRGTFYVYYMDIYDLLEKLETEAKDLIERYMKVLVKGIIFEKDITAYLPAQEVIEKNYDLLGLMLGEKADPAFVNSIKSMAKGYVMKTLHINPEKLPIKTKFVIEYIASGQYGVVSYWYQQGMPLLVEEFVPLLKTINFKGPVKQLLKFANLTAIERT